MLKNAIEKGKTGIILLLLGSLAGAGLVLWLTRRKKKAGLLPPSPEPISINIPRQPTGTSGMGEHMGNPARYETTNLDNEVEDLDVDFDSDGSF